jgi:biopolymer transport protein ExbD
VRRSYSVRRVMRHQRRPAELLLVPMIDIFTVLVTFLLMTAVFSRTVILELKLPPSNAEYKEPPPGLQLEVTVRKDLLQVADRNSGPLATFPNKNGDYDFDGLSTYLQLVKSKFPDKTDATVLLEPDTLYDTVVQVMDHVRVLEVNTGLSSTPYELFPDVSIGDAAAPAPAGAAAAVPPTPAPAAAGAAPGAGRGRR